ncbi:DNA polymerase III subunit gamma and tau [Actinoplanes sp. NPDC049265]|uniref:DNA polymerase III subunit gamma and tau n=1 Tax=Actinoplanes sp. NPDC049265 TaxID=3363902 RepID=UPI0037124D0C
MALALYRKYRPRTFAEVIGQEHVTEPLSQALRSGRLHHAYLFSGPRGCGKTSSARILARSLNCEQGPTPEPCGVCASCKSLANDGTGSIDVIEIDAASHGGVDDARELREKAFFAPASSRYKIYVIDEAHMVSSAGFNALLKLVEEPPEYVKFIFATTEPEKVLGTIRSRTHHYPFRLIPPAVLRPYLQQLTEAEGVHVDPAVFPLVVRAGGGSARDTLSVLDQLIAGAGPAGVDYARAVALLGVTDVALIDEMCDALAAGDGAAAYATIDRVAEAGHDPRRFASDLLERFRDLIVLQQVPDAVAKGLIDGPADQLDAMGAQATRLGPAQLSRSADIVHNGLVEMRGTTAPRLLLELITARMLLPGADDSHGALLQRLERMERRLTLSDFSQVRPDDATPSLPDANAGGGTGSTPPEAGTSPQPSGAPATSTSGGLNAARAAAAAASRRAPAGGLPTAQRPSTPAAPSTPSPAPSEAPPSAPPTTAAAAPATSPSTAAPAAPPVSAPPAFGQASAPAPAQTPASVAPAPPASATPSVQAQAPAQAPVSAQPASATPPAVPGVPSASAYDEDEWPDEPPHYDDEAPPARPVPPQAAPTSGGAQPPRRPDPGAILPDAPDDGVEPIASGQLTAAAVREVWPEIITSVSRQSKKVAALASGATVRDLDGQTVVLTFRFPAHAKMVADQPQLLVDALYETLGGRWQIRCEVAGEGGPAPRTAASNRGPAQPAPTTQNGPSHNGPNQREPSAQPTRQRESAPRRAPQPPADDSDDWPEPVRPAQPSADRPVPAQPAAASADRPAPAATSAESDSAQSAGVDRSDPAQPAAAGGDWPEPARPPASGDDWPEPARPGAAASPPPEDDTAWPEPVRPGSAAPAPAPRPAPTTAAAPADGPEPGPTGPSTGLAAARAAASGTAAPATPTPRPNAAPTAATPDQPPPRPAAPDRTQSRPAPAPDRTQSPAAPTTPDRTPARPAPSPGLAAARAAAAASAGRQTAAKTSATPGAAQPPAGPANAPTQPGASAWPDGSPADEAPYDPEFDGPPRSFDGFDPGDEPLDDVIDEKSARQNSEQQAMDLLRQAFGAEKIGETTS